MNKSHVPADKQQQKLLRKINNFQKKVQTYSAKNPVRMRQCLSILRHINRQMSYMMYEADQEEEEAEDPTTEEEEDYRL